MSLNKTRNLWIGTLVVAAVGAGVSACGPQDGSSATKTAQAPATTVAAAPAPVVVAEPTPVPARRQRRSRLPCRWPSRWRNRLPSRCR